MSTRESMEFDVVIVGGGPAGLATACRVRQLAQQSGRDISVCVVEKGSEIGAHILSGAVFEVAALAELFPDWQERGAPLRTPVSREGFHFLLNEAKSLAIPTALLPKALHNQGNYVISLGELCRWLGEQAEALGVEIFSGFAAAEILYGGDDEVIGIATGDMGLDKHGQAKASHQSGYELLAKYTVFAEGCRGHLGKQLIAKYGLDRGRSPQHYGLGIKEIWQVKPERHEAGTVLHGVGWPLGYGKTTGGFFLYHLENHQVAVGLITDLNYQNPYLSPFKEFQRMKHHPLMKNLLEGGKRLSYGARALSKGGLQSLPELSFPGGLLVGDEAGFLNFLKLKGSHAAIKSGMLAAESIVPALDQGAGSKLSAYQEAFEGSWLKDELYQVRNCGPAVHLLGTVLGSAFALLDQKIFRGRLPFTLKDNKTDHLSLKTAAECNKIKYPKADKVLSFDKNSSVFLSNTNHEEDQPCHLQLADSAVPLSHNLPKYDEPARRYCPAGVYEVLTEEDGGPRFQINAQNCVHCKTCDIKDPSQNITWVSPEGGGGPNYPNM